MVTVITATLNNRDKLLETINNVRAFVDGGVEHIVIDGASADGTIEMLEDLALHHPALRWISEPDTGIYDAMNKGWAMACSSRILILGAGDRLISLPDAQELQDCSDSVIYGNVLAGERLFRAKAGDCLRLSNTLHHQALLVPKRLHPAVPFDIRFRCYADFDFNQRLYKQGERFVYSENFKSYADPGGVSARKDRRELFRVISKNFGLGYALFVAVATPLRRRCWQGKVD